MSIILAGLALSKASMSSRSKLVLGIGAQLLVLLAAPQIAAQMTQQAIMAMGNLFIFPQMFLSGIFFPIDSLPELVQPLASLLPLSFVANALREIASNGLSLLEILPELAGITVWLVGGFLLATRLFVWKEVAN